MAAIYFPSCNFTKASPRAAKRLRDYMKERMPVAGCCRVDKTPYPAGDTALYFCQACRETLEAKEGNQLLLENLFVWLDRQEDFPWPDYSGLVVNVQDCWRDRKHPEIFQAVRSCLGKMRVQVREFAGTCTLSLTCRKTSLWSTRGPACRCMIFQRRSRLGFSRSRRQSIPPLWL